MLRRNNAQSIVEYAILLGVVIAALLIMQLFVKRGYQGGLKDSTDKIGEQFSTTGTTIKQTRKMVGADAQQVIAEGTATEANFTSLFPAAKTAGAKDTTLTQGIYSYSERTQPKGEIESNTNVSSTSLSQEKKDYTATQAWDTVQDF